MHQDYPEPIRALLSYGDPRKMDNPDDPYGGPNYVEKFGLSLEDVPHLTRMLDDPIPDDAGPEDPRLWAAMHARRALGQLGAIDISMRGDLEDVESSARASGSTPQPHAHSHACGTHCHADHDEKKSWRKTLPQSQRSPKIGRNDPCLCGSGKKHKKCCLVQ